jgi:hypothetical protein
MRLTEMVSLRLWLSAWGKEHCYPEVSFPIGNGLMGDFRAGVILAGEGHWTTVMRWEDMEFVAKAVEWIQQTEKTVTTVEQEPKKATEGIVVENPVQQSLW